MNVKSLQELEQIRYPEGERVYAQGEAAEAAFLVAKGKIGIYKTVDNRKVHVRTLCGGAIFGVTAAVDGGGRASSAVTLAPSLLVRIPTALLHGKLDKSDPFIRQLVTTLAGNLRDLHRLHQVRPRSLHDYIRQLDDQAENLRKFMINVAIDVAKLSSLSAEVDRLQGVIDDIKKVVVDVEDRRDDIFPDPSQLH